MDNQTSAMWAGGGGETKGVTGSLVEGLIWRISIDTLFKCHFLGGGGEEKKGKGLTPALILPF